MFSNVPDIVLRGHPAQVIELVEIYGHGVVAQGFFAMIISVFMKIGDYQFSDVSVNWVAITEYGVI